MRHAYFLLLVGALLGVSLAKHHHAARAPIINLQGAEELVAVVREDENIISTVPDFAILSETGPVCNYLLSSQNNEPVPFDIQVVDKYTGAAVLRVKDAATLDCKKPEYNLQVQAVKCDNDKVKSEMVSLKIRVKDTNNHAPEIENPWYTFHVEEGKVIEEVGVLKASDKDCGHPNGEICEYEITNGLKELPFAISNQGVLRTTQPLNYTQSKSYILTVVAIDCAMRKSKSALVTVHVDEKCVQGITAMNDRVNYAPGVGSKLLLPDVSLEFCEKESVCEPTSVQSVIELRAGHVTQGCARDTVYDNQTIQSCGLSTATVKLLNEDDLTSSAENQILADQGIEFDGARGLTVTDNIHQGLIPDHFTLSFSMKHAAGTKDEQSNKQNILCESDDFNMNRHHFSVYIRHCKLEVVLRREAGATADFRAAEWRWSLPEVCDNEWHSYSLLFNGIDDVNVVVDGKSFNADERNPEILDDWPLHKTKASKTKLVVGACWHGRQQKLSQFFRGQLSALYLLRGAVESERAIKCAHTCPEQLQFTGVDELLEGQTATFSPDQTTLTLKAETAKQMGQMLKRVAYVNTQEKPAPGHRTFHVETEVTCKQEEKKIRLPVSKGYVFVQQISEPTLSISASSQLKSNQHMVKVGQAMVPDLTITVSQNNADGELEDVTQSHKIDYCKMHLQPARDMDVEYFSSPASLIAALNIEFEHDKDGILLRGEESAQGYKEVLSKVHYFNTRPESYAKRTYTVQCAMLKGRVLSNQLFVTMTIDGVTSTTTSTTETPVAQPIQFTFNSGETALDSLELIERHFEPAFDQLGSSRLQNILEMDLPRPKALLSHHGYDVGQGAIAGGAVAVVVVVCVGFLLVLLVIGVLKMRDTPMPRRRRQKRQSDGGMHWDDSGMNITVNPLDDVEKNGGIAEEFSDEEEEEEESDAESCSECSYRDEDDDVTEDEEDHPEVLPHIEANPRVAGALEWDDEDAMPTNARSYRV
uniref:Cadherin domain-containing protein n=1 Tax=Caenorhabditis japonica TaxID=281687 RepID=A0A8R1I3A4_CAEJA